ncbi:hypothetical protein C6989_08050 [Nitrosopumilus sp. b2]|nr:hypothetical protein C6989_08050 [Nitrosopumilus sp. b2]
MKNQNDKFGIIMSVAITAVLLGVVGSVSATNDGSIQPQGQAIIDRTTNEIQDIPNSMQDVTSNALKNTEDVISEIPDVAEEIIEESNSVSEFVDNTGDIIEDTMPEVPVVVKQTEGKLLEMVSIPQDTGVPGCEESDTCYLPIHATMNSGGEVIWTNHDSIPHTVTSGNPSEGPDGIFDSGLIMPGKTYSVQLDLAFEYDYFCIVHPWMQGTITIQ